jgi:hypothetical protein
MRYLLFSCVIVATSCISLAAFSKEDRPIHSRWTMGDGAEYVHEDYRLYRVVGDKRKEVQLPGPAISVHSHGDEIYVALGSQGVVIFIQSEDGNLQKKKHIPAARGRVVGFFEVDGLVWMQIESTMGAPVNESSFPAAEASDSGRSGDEKISQAAVDRGAEEDSPKLMNRKEQIRIESILLGEVMLNIGAHDGVEESDSFTVFRQQVITKRGYQEFTGKKQVGVLRVVAVNEGSSLAIMSRGDRLRKDDNVRPYEPKDRQYQVFPQRLNHLGEVSLALRPLLKVDGKGRGFGGLCDATVSWWGKHYFLNFRTQPVAVGWTSDGNIVSSSILGEGGYDGRAFAVGIGAGVGLVNGDMDAMIAQDDYWNESGDTTTRRAGTRAAFALSQTVRLGARDGLNAVVHNHFLYYNDKTASNKDEDDSGFIYGGTSGRFNIPLSHTIDLFMAGGGGQMGYAFGEIGIFVWILGKGDAGSWGLSAAAGGAGIWIEHPKDDLETQRTTIAGPLFSLGETHILGVKRP